MSHGVAAGVGFIILVASGAAVASSSTQDEPEVSPTKARARDVYDVLRPIYEEASRVVGRPFEYPETN